MAIYAGDFPDYRVLAPLLGLRLDATSPTGGFKEESDWYYHVGGYGAPTGAGPRARWLVTYAASTRGAGDPDAPADGWLVAFYFNEHDEKTGRCLLLAGPWNRHKDSTLFNHQTRPTGPGNDVTIEQLLEWLRTVDA